MTGPVHLLDTVTAQHRANYDLWHTEDRARAPYATDTEIAQVKRAIDHVNQQRNDLAELCDTLLLAALAPENLPSPAAELHSESPGLIIDRLSILALKLYHTREELSRATPAHPNHQQRNRERLAILSEQRQDLAHALVRLWHNVLAGRARFKLYRQLKMYNDPTLNPAIYARATPANPHLEAPGNLTERPALYIKRGISRNPRALDSLALREAAAVKKSSPHGKHKPPTHSKTIAAKVRPITNTAQAHALTHYQAAIEAMQQGKFEKAAQTFAKIESDCPIEIRERVRVYVAACNRYLTRIERSFAGPEEQYDYAISLINTGDYEEARDQLEAIVREHHNADYAHYGLAVLGSMTGQAEVCLDHLAQAITLNPHSRIQARSDADFRQMNDDPRFTEPALPGGHLNLGHPLPAAAKNLSRLRGLGPRHPRHA